MIFSVRCQFEHSKIIFVTNIKRAVMSKVKVTLEGEQIELDLDQSGHVILEAVLQAGHDAPFSCRGGICTTCKAKVLEGKVEMETNFALSDGEIEEGYILTCQSHPVTPEVVLSYDDV
jgi:ring-1,2-phenylacetyl-CoA epoxidase subunit PaaE